MGSDYRHWKPAVEKLMQSNRRSYRNFSYTLPSPNSYPYQWFWDSCFHAIILSHFDAPSAKAELKSLTHWQYKNGMIPHMIFWDGSRQTSFAKISWGRKKTSSLIQPPMLAYAAWRVYEADNDKVFLGEMLPHIHKLHSFLFRKRDPRHHNLIGVVNPDESGEDNSPRFDSSLALSSKHTIGQNYQRRLQLIERFRNNRFVIKNRMDKAHWVRDVPINAIFAANLRKEAEIARVVGDESGAAWAAKHAAEVEKAMRTFMLDKDGIMLSHYGRSYKPVNVKTWAMFAPLFAGVLTQEEAETIVRNHLLNPGEFLTKYGVPTVAKSEASFDPQGFWRGPVWMATNWFIYQGLQRYGFGTEAELVKKHSLQLLEKSGFREQYNPLNGEGMGAEEFTWGGLVLDML